MEKEATTTEARATAPARAAKMEVAAEAEMEDVTCDDTGHAAIAGMFVRVMSRDIEKRRLRGYEKRPRRQCSFIGAGLTR